MKEHEIRYMLGTENIQVIPRIPFDIQVCNFLDALSKNLRKDEEARSYTDIITFSFWIRKSNIMKLKKKYEEERRMGRGLVFHIASSNVPLNFAYTFIFGLLSGNSNIVKASSKDFQQTKIFCRILNQLLLQNEYRWVKEQNAIVIYEIENNEITKNFSDICNIRVIWGGDRTIQKVRKVPLQTKSIEITFANRYSFAIISAKAVLETNEKLMKNFVKAFYNDTYFMDQNAFSTPHLICWYGENQDVENAKNIFWKEIDKYVRENYLLEDIKVSDKYTILCEMVLKGIITEVKRYDNYLYVGTVETLPDDISVLMGKYGFFFEYHMKALNDLSVSINEKIQTCAVYGIEKEEICRWIEEENIKGIDRIISFGQGLNIGLVWDGYDIIRILSRRIMI